MDPLTPKGIENILDASEKLKEAIEGLKKQSKDAKAEVTQLLVKDLAATPFSVDGAIAKYKAWNAKGEALAAKITAAEELLSVIDEGIKELKKTEEKALGSAIDRKVGELEEVIKSLKALK
jgi:chaperonin cofactor prefoldin